MTNVPLASSPQAVSEDPLIRHGASDQSNQWPPMPLDGPAFVVIHGKDNPSQIYGQTYSFTSAAAGVPERLISALQDFSSKGTPVYLVIYRPGPEYAFTAWARVRAVHEEPSGQPDNSGSIKRTLTLEQHEFPVRLNLKGNAQNLVTQIPWLSEDLRSAFSRHSVFANLNGALPHLP